MSVDESGPANTRWILGHPDRLLGLPHYEIGSSADLLAAIHPDDTPWVAGEWRDAWERGGSTVSQRFRLKDDEDDRRWLLHVARIDPDSGEQTGVLTDITAQQLLEERTRQSERLSAIGRIANEASETSTPFWV